MNAIFLVVLGVILLSLVVFLVNKAKSETDESEDLKEESNSEVFKNLYEGEPEISCVSILDDMKDSVFPDYLEEELPAEKTKGPEVKKQARKKAVKEKVTKKKSSKSDVIKDEKKKTKKNKDIEPEKQSAKKVKKEDPKKVTKKDKKDIKKKPQPNKKNTKKDKLILS